jgi:hypothetical protein
MYCHYCGAKAEATAERCPVCAQPLQRSDTPFTPPQAPPPPAQPFIPPPTASAQTGKWVSEAWEIVKSDLPMFALLALIVAAIGSCVPIILQGAMAVGFHIAIIKKMRTGRPLDLADCFKGFDFLVPALVAALLISIFVTLGTLACIIPGLIVHAMYQFTYLLILDKRLDFWPAMQASLDLVKTDFTGFVVFALALLGLNIAGALMCFVGLLITIPISVVAVTLAYRDLVGFEPQTGTV